MAVDTKPLVDHPRVVARRRRWLNRLGKTLMTAGVLLILFVAWELWGTNLLEARHQSSLEAAIVEEGLPGYDLFRHEDSRAFVKPGDGIGYLRIPKVDLDKVFVQSTTTDALRKAPGHYLGTPLPGQRGNVGIAGHRTTYGAPFWSLDKLRWGDRIEVDTARGHFVYRVTWVKVVHPSEIWVLNPTKVRPVITLTTCNPRFSAAQRLVVRAVQVIGPHPEGTQLASQRMFDEPREAA